MSDYPLWAYEQQLQQKARQELGYGNPLMDQKQAHAIRLAIDEKVQAFSRRQQKDLRDMVNRAKDKL